MAAGLPYVTVFEPPKAFKDPKRVGLIPDVPITAKVSFAERERGAHLLNPNLYQVQLTHGPFEWTVKRRYKHFTSLNQKLSLYKMTLSIPLPTRQHRARRETARELGGVSAHRLPSLPTLPETFVTENHVEARAEELEEYLNIVLSDPLYRDHGEVLEFLEVSGLSFVEELGGKGKEGLIQKRPWETRREANCCFRCAYMCVDITSPAWRHRWLVIKDTWIAYIQPSSGKIHAVMLFDQGFEVMRGLMQTQIPHGLVISNLSRNLVIRCWTKRKTAEWREEILAMAESKGKEFIKPQRHDSYAPVRENISAGWFVDGASYMEAVAAALESAQEEIFIADWWLSPEIYLRRPMYAGEAWRLDVVLQRKAEQGVKVFVMLYKEVELALGINSLYSKTRLVSKNRQNIKVLRHPDHVPGGILYWAHHEKLVIVDQTVAFVGGIDLCYGRWDDAKHRLVDLGSVTSGNAGAGDCGKCGVFMPPTTFTSSSARPGDLPSTIFQLAKATHQVSISTLKTNGKSNGDVVVATSAADGGVVVVTGVDTVDRVANGGDVGIVNGDGGAGDEVVKADDGTDKKNEAGDDDEDAVSEHAKGDTPPPERHGTLANKIRAMRQAVSRGKEWREKIALKVRKSDASGAGGGDGDGDGDGDKEKGRENEDQETTTTAEALAGIVEDVDAEIEAVMGSPPDIVVENVEGETIVGEDMVTATVVAQVDMAFQPRGDEADLRATLMGSSKLWMGKDYANFIVKDFSNLDSPYKDLVDRTTTPRMPWHDIATVVHGKAARDVARHFIERWNAAKLEKFSKNDEYPYLLPKAYDSARDEPREIPDYKCPHYNVSCQILRSATSWSAGISTVEQSIHTAYIDAICGAKYFVYIENQFFVSTGPGANPGTENRIADALFERICRAAANSEVFRVYVVMPLLPGFEGQVGTPGGTAIQVITHWNYASMCRGPHSLIRRLFDKGVEDPYQYVQFFGLRTHAELNGVPVTELIYVHSKLMIVDDRLVICGSANINDRSMIGSRDSEVAVLIEDGEMVDGVMNGEPVQVSKYAQALRTNLFREHLGLLEIQSESGSGSAVMREDFDVTDPVSKSFWYDVWFDTADLNTRLYEKTFSVVPTDKAPNFAALREMQRNVPLAVSDPDTAKELLKGIRGYLVCMPQKFLEEEDLVPDVGTKEYLLPTAVWT